MTTTNQALQAIGLTLEDFERRDFYRRSGRKAGAVLRSLGFRRDRYPTYGGRAVIRWFWPESEAPVFLDDIPAFHVLVAALAAKS
jgi:hypothetical protein